MEFDLAIAFRLEIYDGEVRKGQARRIAYEVSKLFGDGSDDEGNATGDIDPETQVW